MQKTCNAYGASTMRSSKNGIKYKPWLDQTNNHSNMVTTMLIHTWNEQPNMQANKLKCKVSFACPTLNQCTQQVCI